MFRSKNAQSLTVKSNFTLKVGHLLCEDHLDDEWISSKMPIFITPIDEFSIDLEETNAKRCDWLCACINIAIWPDPLAKCKQTDVWMWLACHVLNLPLTDSVKSWNIMRPDDQVTKFMLSNWVSQLNPQCCPQDILVGNRYKLEGINYRRSQVWKCVVLRYYLS